MTNASFIKHKALNQENPELKIKKSVYLGYSPFIFVTNNKFKANLLNPCLNNL